MNRNIDPNAKFIKRTKRFLVYLPNYFRFLSVISGSWTLRRKWLTYLHTFHVTKNRNVLATLMIFTHIMDVRCLLLINSNHSSLPWSSMIYPISLLPTPCCLVSNENYLVEDKLSCVYIIMTLPSSTKLLTPDIYSKFTNTFPRFKFSSKIFSIRVPEG